MQLSKENLTKEERKRLKALKRAEKETSIVLESMPADISVTILCVRFGNRYGRDYVERLRNMVARNLTIPYEFVCLTDDQHPIEGVRSIVQPNAGYAKGWWHKVHMFDPALPLSGRILYFDLDVVIHNKIDKLAAFQPNEFLGILDFNRKFYAEWKNLNSSAMAWNHRTQNHIWDQFKANPKEAMRLPGDQDWIWKTSRNIIKFWPREWIQSYKWEIRRREELTVLNGKRQFKSVDHNVEIEPECSVTVFHGDPKPQDVQDKFVVDNWR
jgi:hypothetical protein